MDDFFPFEDIEGKWQKRWEELFRCDITRTGNKYYCLMMFPYPSGDVHVGHGRNYIIGDALARIKMMDGENVLAPMGWDSFGLPAENAAIRKRIHPAEWTEANIENRPGGPGKVLGQLVSLLQDGACERAGCRRRVRAVWGRSASEEAEAVVFQDTELCGPPDR